MGSLCETLSLPAHNKLNHDCAYMYCNMITVMKALCEFDYMVHNVYHINLNKVRLPVFYNSLLLSLLRIE
jgi:competence transcription factor ComK